MRTDVGATGKPVEVQGVVAGFDGPYPIISVRKYEVGYHLKNNASEEGRGNEGKADLTTTLRTGSNFVRFMTDNHQVLNKTTRSEGATIPLATSLLECSNSRCPFRTCQESLGCRKQLHCLTDSIIRDSNCGTVTLTNRF